MGDAEQACAGPRALCGRQRDFPAILLLVTCYLLLLVIYYYYYLLLVITC